MNPAYDKTVEVKDLIPHETNPILTVRFDPGGKGINVSRVVKTLGCDTEAFGIIGGETGLSIKSYLESQNIKTNFIEIEQPTRTNLKVIDIGDPPATEFNDPGPLVDENIICDVVKKIEQNIEKCSIIVFAGSLPRGCPDDTYFRLIEMVKKKGCKSILDTRDEPLIEGVKALPFMIKPNATEASFLLKRTIETTEQAIQASTDLYEMGIEIPVISLGRKGAVLTCDEGTFKSTPPIITAESTVGSGDSMVAGICAGLLRGMSKEDALKLGTAAGAATAMTPGTELAKKEDVENLLNKVKIEKL
jgi:1-phosphofructokinase